MKQKLANYFRAGYPAVAINSSEEQRVLADVFAAAKERGKGLLTWSATEGICIKAPAVKTVPDTTDLLPACNFRVKDTIYVLRDIAGWPFDRDPILTRAFRDLIAWGPTEGSCVVVIGPTFTPHPTVEKLFVVTDYTLPDAGALETIAKNIAASAGKEINGNIGPVVRALSGLSTTEAENAVALSIVETGGLDPDVVYREKVQSVRRSGLLEIIDPDPRGLEAIGGMDLFKRFLVERAEMFHRWAEAISFGLTGVKGVFFVGPPGTGKSQAAKCLGTIFRCPVLRWDIARTFASLVGETERRTAETLALADAMAPCGLWLDEIDKAFAGVAGGGANDAGVGMKMFGQVITWMQERRKPVFLFATANDVTALPSALYRKGRFDEIFSVDLPNIEEREAIFKIHLKKRKRDMATYLERFADATDEFVGAEIEAVIESAMFRAFAEKRDVTPDDIIAAVQRTVPIARTAKAEIDKMRAWSKSNATPASSPTVVKPKTARRIG